ncbi:MAG: hypothetical protein KAT35_03860 [Candidatus Aenigmarchaeota archaeon]|nr:hypothetical protein [Candidatus Aenigmarchaeota archaeon]
MNEPLYLVTKDGVDILMRDDGQAIREKIMEKADALAYRYYDDERKAWALWAVQDGEDVRPLAFLKADAYGITSAELYSKTVTYPTILAQVIGLINAKVPTLWEKLMKPTTVVGAIVLIVLIMIIGVVAVQG